MIKLANRVILTYLQVGIGVHLPVESLARKLLRVALPPPHFNADGDNHTNARMQIRDYSFAFEIQESFGLLALRLTRLTAHWQPQQVQRVSLSKLVPTHHCNRCRKRTAIAELQQTKEQKAKPMI